MKSYFKINYYKVNTTTSTKGKQYFKEFLPKNTLQK